MSEGIIFNIKRFAIHDGPGIRSTVFLKGCPLKCTWCHNPESQKNAPEMVLTETGNSKLIGEKVSVDHLVAEIVKDTIFFDESVGGVTISGGEPLAQPQFLREVLHKLKSHEIHTAIDTTGFARWETIYALLPDIDLFLFDLKLIDPILHRRYTGVENNLILSNLRALVEHHQNINIRIPIIPTITDTERNLQDIRDFLLSLHSPFQINILPYNPLGTHKYQQLHQNYKLKELHIPPRERMEEIQRFFLQDFPSVIIGG